MAGWGKKVIIALQNQIAEDAQEWVRHKRDASYLYTGAKLANAREQLAGKKMAFSGPAQAFVQAGVEVAEAERQREEAYRQKELDDALRMAEAARARARADRRSNLLLRALLVVMLIEG